MDKKVLEDGIVNAVRPLMEKFRNQPSPAEDDHKKAIKKLESQIKSAKDDVVRDALSVGLKKLKSDGPDKVDRSADEQKAWNAAARRLRISTRTSRARKSAGNRMRRSAEAVENAAEKVMDVMEEAAFQSKSEIAEKTGMAKGLLRSAMARLKREGEIESNGERGPTGAWRKVSGKKKSKKK